MIPFKVFFLIQLVINIEKYISVNFLQKSGIYHIPKSVIFASEECHYSSYKFAAFLGIGEHNVIGIRTDEIGQMIPNELTNSIQTQIEEGAVPIMVIATLGMLQIYY